MSSNMGMNFIDNKQGLNNWLLFVLDFNVALIIFQSYRYDVCNAAVSSDVEHRDIMMQTCSMMSHPVTLSWHQANQS